jgi:hypothetical protein
VWLYINITSYVLVFLFIYKCYWSFIRVTGYILVFRIIYYYYWLFSDPGDDFLATAAMLLNRTHAEEQYVGEGERPNRRRSKRSLDDEYHFASEINKPKRRKRSYSQERFIEIMVVADKKMAEYHGDSLYHYILTLMSIVRTLLLLLLLLLILLLVLLLLLLSILLFILSYSNKAYAYVARNGPCVCTEHIMLLSDLAP